jgi:multimeric flavodoxin WrbA
MDVQPDARVDKIVLIDRRIEYCRNCMTCRKDDMQAIYPLLNQVEAYIFGTPINVGRETAIMKTFIEWIGYVLLKPGKYPIDVCPTPRTTKKEGRRRHEFGDRAAAFRMFCDDVTSIIEHLCSSMLNACLVGSLYVGAVEKRGADFYTASAYQLGRKLQAS